MERVALVLDPRYRHGSNDVCLSPGVDFKAVYTEGRRERGRCMLVRERCDSTERYRRPAPDSCRSKPPPATKETKPGKLGQRREARLYAAASGGRYAGGDEGGRSDVQHKTVSDRSWQVK